MNIRATSQNFEGSKLIRIKSIYKKNKGNDFLYNDVLNIVRETNTPATFANTHIDISYITKPLIDMLKSANIGFRRINK